MTFHLEFEAIRKPVLVILSAAKDPYHPPIGGTSIPRGKQTTPTHDVDWLGMAAPSSTVRFGPFEVDLRESDLRKRGAKLKLQGQPFQVLAALLQHPGQVVTREELRQSQDTFVDFDHSLNTAVNKVREVLGDSPSDPKYIETVPKRGYRFIASLEKMESAGGHSTALVTPVQRSEDALPSASRPAIRFLFALIQVMYLIFYVAALVKLEIIGRLYRGRGPLLQLTVLLTAILAIPIRLYLLSAVSFDYAGLGAKFRRIFPAICLLDFLWALSPFLIAYLIGIGSAFAAMAALLYLPFAQRTLLRMGYSHGEKDPRKKEK